MKVHALYAAVAGMAAALLVWFFFMYLPLSEKLQTDDAGIATVEEGIELMKEIRVINRARFPEKPNCWNTKLETTNVAACERLENKITPGFYAVTKNVETGSPVLTMIPAPFDQNNPSELYRLKNDGAAAPMYRELRIKFVEGLGNADASDAMEVQSSVFYEDGTLPMPLKRILVLTKAEP